MNNINKLLAEVITQARAIKIPVSEFILPEVVINSRATTRFGCCKKKGEHYIIEVTDRLLDAPESSCRRTLAHEILHTCWGCRNHGARWKEYAKRMNEGFGYFITRTETCERLGVENKKTDRHLVVCTKCGAEFRRSRESKLTKKPELYHCKCGGALRREY